jgi:cytochrome c oxidase accessory protein FixG
MANNPDFRDTLYTVDQRGNRKWVYATIVDGFFRKRRRWVILGLMGFYLTMPWIHIKGEQAILINILNRKFTFFGNVFLPTDSIYLFLMLAIAALTLFLVTAVVGRIWCGWACPETVFLEFLFRPIERWIEGDHLARRALDAAPWSLSKLRKKLTKHGIYAILSWVLASTFLAYFVGREPLLNMMTHWPWENPFPFGVTLFLMGVMAFQFGWFREQFCTIVCPYGRFQSVLLDQNSLVIGYDVKRGEPRRPLGQSPDKSASPSGDCINCGNCVKVCPTGIDIRNGLQLECINCAACIDACDAVMEKIKKPHGLIRYASQSEFEGTSTKILRPRVVVYTLLLATLFSVFVAKLATRELSDFHIVRGALDAPFQTLEGGVLLNHLHLRLTNKSDRDQHYTVVLSEAVAGLELTVPQNPFPVAPQATVTIPLFFKFPAHVLQNDTHSSQKTIRVRVTSAEGFSGEETVTLIGPGPGFTGATHP